MGAAIRFEQVCKQYRLVRQKPFLAHEVLRRVLQRASSWQYHRALHDLSFELAHGGSLGVIGVNGSGKSTLLSLIARTSYPTTGSVQVEGRVGPLLELGAGFHQDLTGFENIFLNASLLGLQRQDVEQRLQSIIDYAELGDYIEAPIKTYSTGMRARLGFAVIAHIDPEILLIDEALSVGDGYFQEKCERTMTEMRRAGRTLVVVSHSLDTVTRLCTRCLWIHQGRLRMDGPSDAVVEAYRQFLAAGGGGQTAGAMP